MVVRYFETHVLNGPGNTSAADVGRMFSERKELAQRNDGIVGLRREEVFADGFMEAGEGGQGVGDVVVC